MVRVRAVDSFKPDAHWHISERLSLNRATFVKWAISTVAHKLPGFGRKLRLVINIPYTIRSYTGVPNYKTELK